MVIKHFHDVLTIIVITSILMLLSCVKVTKPIIHDYPQLNNVRMIEKKRLPDKERKVWVVLQAPGIEPEELLDWRTRYIPLALREAGLRNFKVTETKIQQLNSTDIGDHYLLVIFLNNLSVKEKNSGDKSIMRLWLSLTASMYDFPMKSVVARLGGSATDTADLNDWSVGEMCSSLIEEMMKNMYAMPH